VAIGRKNWQFAGSEDGARAAATVYTLVESARASKVDPLAYIEALLRKLGQRPALEAAGLTPWELAGELPVYRPRIERS
jgi:transposase